MVRGQGANVTPSRRIHQFDQIQTPPSPSHAGRTAQDLHNFATLVRSVSLFRSLFLFLGVLPLFPFACTCVFVFQLPASVLLRRIVAATCQVDFNLNLTRLDSTWTDQVTRSRLESTQVIQVETFFCKILAWMHSVTYIHIHIQKILESFR